MKTATTLRRPCCGGAGIFRPTSFSRAATSLPSTARSSTSTTWLVTCGRSTSRPSGMPTSAGERRSPIEVQPPDPDELLAGRVQHDDCFRPAGCRRVCRGTVRVPRRLLHRGRGLRHGPLPVRDPQFRQAPALRVQGPRRALTRPDVHALFAGTKSQGNNDILPDAEKNVTAFTNIINGVAVLDYQRFYDAYYGGRAPNGGYRTPDPGEFGGTCASEPSEGHVVLRGRQGLLRPDASPTRPTVRKRAPPTSRFPHRASPPRPPRPRATSTPPTRRPTGPSASSRRTTAPPTTSGSWRRARRGPLSRCSSGPTARWSHRSTASTTSGVERRQLRHDHRAQGRLQALPEGLHPDVRRVGLLGLPGQRPAGATGGLAVPRRDPRPLPHAEVARASSRRSSSRRPPRSLPAPGSRTNSRSRTSPTRCSTSRSSRLYLPYTVRRRDRPRPRRACYPCGDASPASASLRPQRPDRSHYHAPRRASTSGTSKSSSRPLTSRPAKGGPAR